MDKLGKILIPVSLPTVETNGTLTGDGTNTQLGLNYSAWKFNTDELLWSGGPQSSIQVNFPLNLYERVMFRLGHNGYGKQFEEYNTNTTRFFLNPLFAKNSANSEVWFEMNEWQYGDSKRDLVWQGHCYRRNLKAGGGVFEDLNTNVEGYEAEKYPISEVWGVNRIDFNAYNVYLNSTEGGTLTSNKPSGYNGEICTLIPTPETEDWKCSAINVTGATLTGNYFMFENSDVSANAKFEHNKTLTLINGEHGILSADKDKGFSGDVVNVVANTEEGWYFTGFNITGAPATGTKFMFVGENVTAEGLYTDEGFPVVYEAEDGVHLTGDSQIAIPGQGITLTTSYDTYYRTNGYDITGGYIEDGILYATAPCTARLKSKLNTFTAYGDFNMITAGTYIIENGATSNAISYAHYVSGDNVPSSYYNLTLSSNNGGNINVKESGWNPSEEISGYWLSADTIAESWSERLSTRITASLQSNEIDFGNVITTSIGGGKTYVENLHSETFTPGITRRYLNVYNATTRHYFQNLRNITQNSWTATGYAP